MSIDLEQFKRERKYFSIVVAVAFYMSFIAGYINVISLYGISGDPVSYVTGTVSSMGIHLLHNRHQLPNEVLLVIAFLLGAFIASFILGEISYQKRRPYGFLFIFDALMLCISVLVFSQYFQAFTQEHVKYMLAFSCGMQNSMITAFTGAVLRTTHMTGTVTDIGLITARILRSRGKTGDAWKIKYLVPLLLGYLLGSTAGSAIFPVFQFYSLLFPSISQVIIGGLHILFVYNRKSKSRNPLKDSVKCGLQPLVEPVSREEHTFGRDFLSYGSISPSATPRGSITIPLNSVAELYQPSKEEKDSLVLMV